MNSTDIQILKLLQTDSGLSAADIADRVNLSQSSCWRRIDRLHHKGIIKRNVAVLDRDKLGMEVVVFVMIGLVSQTGGSLEEFESRIKALPEVLECYTITGQSDYILKVVTRDMRHYEKFMRTQLAQVPNIREMHSHVAVTQIKDTMELPLETQLVQSTS